MRCAWDTIAYRPLKKIIYTILTSKIIVSYKLCSASGDGSISDGLQHDRISVSRTAERLHHVVRKLRQDSGTCLAGKVTDDPLVWAPYIHVGI